MLPYSNIDRLVEWAVEIEDFDRTKAIKILRVAKKLFSRGAPNMSVTEIEEYVMRRYYFEKIIKQ